MSKHPKPNALIWLSLSIFVLALDQSIKWWVLNSLPEYQPIPVIDGFWNWYRTYNTGAAFSFLSNAGGWQKYFLIAIATVITALLTFWLSQTPRRDWKSALPFALVIGGAIGNVIDRLRYGHVVDYIQWYWQDNFWPTFNFADVAVVAGAIGLALFGLLDNRRPAAKPPASGTAAE